MTVNMTTFDTGALPTWCPGCGDFGIWTGLKMALSSMNIGTEDALVCYGVGCHGNMYDWMKIYGFAGLHGRSLPVAQGAKFANHELPVICMCGDGDCLGEGGNHFMHAAKRNTDITVIIHDNQVYGLTTGQAAPTAKQGFKTKSTPEGVVDEPVNPVALALVAGATFVARAFSGDAMGLAEIMKQAINHKGFSIIDVMQPCVTFDKIHTYQWYRQRLYDLGKTDYTPDNRVKALERAFDWGDKIPMGIFYKEDRPSAEAREAALHNGPLNKQELGKLNIDGLLAEFI